MPGGGIAPDEDLLTGFEMVTGPSRRSRSNKTKSKAASPLKLVLVLLAILPLSFWVFWPKGEVHFAPADMPDGLSSLPVYWNAHGSSLVAMRREGPNRPVYPYSVIPGGAESKDELRTALQHDPLAAAHYADFQTQFARVIRLTSARQEYVSYRSGDHIYWTSKKITLHAGETLLTDGTHFARTRCGNRISEDPPDRTSPSEPPEETFDLPVLPPEIDLSKSPLGPLVEFGPSPIMMALNPPTRSGSPGGPFVPFVPLFPCCGSGSPPPSSPKSPALPPPPPPPPPPGSGPPPSPPLPQPEPVPPPTVSTPEPRSLLLLSIGVAGLFCLWALRRA